MSTTINKITRLETQMTGLSTDFKDFKKEVKKGIQDISLKIDCLDKVYLRRDLYERDMKDLERETGSNTGDKQWIIRLVIQIVVTAVVTGVMVKYLS